MHLHNQTNAFQQYTRHSTKNHLLNVSDFDSNYNSLRRDIHQDTHSEISELDVSRN